MSRYITLSLGTVYQDFALFVSASYLVDCTGSDSRIVFWMRGSANQTLPNPKRVPVRTRNSHVLSRKPNICVVPSKARGRIISIQTHQGMPGIRLLLKTKIKLPINIEAYMEKLRAHIPS